MKVGGLPHIAIEPFVTCNFTCDYCVNNRNESYSMKMWDERKGDITRFLKTLDRKMILTSGGEPMLWNGWADLIKEVDHYWYFLSNGSVIPKYLRLGEVKERVKMFIIGYHGEFMGVDRLISNMMKLQDMGYPVFVKMIYMKEDSQFMEWERVNNVGIPVSFVPLVGGKYTEDEVGKVIKYCPSKLYASRFYHNVFREPTTCVAGTSESFEMHGTKLIRCSHHDIPVIGDIAVPSIMKKMWRGKTKDLAVRMTHKLFGRSNPVLGDIYEPQYYDSPQMCYRKVCDCEWHMFSEMGVDLENERWQHLIDTGKWE